MFHPVQPSSCQSGECGLICVSACQSVSSPSLREQRAGCRHHEDQTVGKQSTKEAKLWNKPRGEGGNNPMTFCTHNTPTIMTWIGPWRNVIRCKQTKKAWGHFCGFRSRNRSAKISPAWTCTFPSVPWL